MMIYKVLLGLSMQEELVSYIKNLVKTVKEKERIEGELQVARKIQMDYLRRDFESFAAQRNFRLSALIKPAREVGGDYYDYFNISEDKIGFTIGDVAGKGVPAALFMTIALTLIRSGNYTRLSLAEVVERINNQLCRRNKNTYFITAFFGVLELKNGRLTFCNAGHNFPYLLKDDDLFEVQATHGPALGIIENQKYKTGQLQLSAGSNILLYTDGVTDAENPQKAFYDKERLEEVLRKHLTDPPAELIHSIYQHIKLFVKSEHQTDDITLLSLQYGKTEQKH